jgi:hypothetical protein
MILNHTFIQDLSILTPIQIISLNKAQLSLLNLSFIIQITFIYL